MPSVKLEHDEGEKEYSEEMVTNPQIKADVNKKSSGGKVAGERKVKKEASQPTIASLFSKMSGKRKSETNTDNVKKLKADNHNVNKIKPISKKCSECQQFLDSSDLKLFPGDPDEALEEFIMLTDPKLSVHTDGEYENDDVTERPQHKITNFCVYDRNTHICPFDAGLVEKNIMLYFSGMVKPVYDDDPSVTGGVFARNLGPIIEWWVSGYDGGEHALIGFGTVTLLNNAKNLLEDAKKYATMKTRCSVAETTCNKPMDCAEIREKNSYANSGVYKIWPRSRAAKGPIDVYCDMEDDGGAWTVLQRRGDFDSGKDYFYKDWQSYKKGFGNPEKDFWLGNDNIFAVTNQRSNIVKFTLTDWEGNKTYATFDEFWIEDESRKYTMHVSGYRGTAGDSFSGTNGLPFTTKDQDNDTYDKNCAVQFKGAWWYSACHSSNLNGMYLKGAHETHADGVEWHGFRGHYYSLKDTVIKIRPKDFQGNPEIVTPH